MTTDRLSVDSLDEESTGVSSKKVEDLFAALSQCTSGHLRFIIDQAHADLHAGLLHALTALATNLQHAVLDSETTVSYNANLLAVLANASRDIDWRTPFGQVTRIRSVPSDTTSILGYALTVIFNISSPQLLVPHALRLIANCCADLSENRRFVVERGGLMHILALSDLKRHAALAIPALYNICIDFQDASGGEEEHGSFQVSQVNNAVKQLAQAQDSQGNCGIEILLNTFDSIQDDRKTLLADLIDMASYPALLGIEHVVPKLDLDASDDPIDIDVRLERLLKLLIISKGPAIAAFSLDCCVSICNASINVLSQGRSQISLLAVDGLISFIQLPYLSSRNGSVAADEEHDTLEDLSSRRKAILKLVYEITATADFEKQYGPLSQGLLVCIELLKKHSPFSDCLYVVLANVTTSTYFAEAFVFEHDIHEVLFQFLNTTEEGVAQGIQFLVRLCLSEKNKSKLVQSGAFNVIQRLLKMQTLEPTTQRDAVLVSRLLIKGCMHHIVNVKASQGSEPMTFEPYISDILNLFERTSDGSTKLEIGRFAIEVYRTLLGAEGAKDLNGRTCLGMLADIAAEAVTFVIRHGQESEQTEGWFGLASMSIWGGDRHAVLHALQSKSMMEDLHRITETKEGPSYANVRLMLAKLQLIPDHEIPAPLFADLKAAAQDAEVLA